MSSPLRSSIAARYAAKSSARETSPRSTQADAPPRPRAAACRSRRPLTRSRPRGRPRPLARGHVEVVARARARMDPQGARAPLPEASQEKAYVSVTALCRMCDIRRAGCGRGRPRGRARSRTTSSSVRHGRGSSSAHAFAISSGCDVGGTPSRSSSETFETASRIAESCSWNRVTSSSESSSRASRATCSTSSREIAIDPDPYQYPFSRASRMWAASRLRRRSPRRVATCRKGLAGEPEVSTRGRRRAPLGALLNSVPKEARPLGRSPPAGPCRPARLRTTPADPRSTTCSRPS